VLWAVADAGAQALIADAHHAPVAEVVAFMEREVAATRTDATGRNGAVAQVDVTGLIATAFDHYDSRAGDPHLHTHVVISNKVQTVLDGKWRSLDGRPMHAATVALSELHEAVFADHLTRLFGVEWEARDMGRDRNPAWAIAAVPEELVTEFSSRSRHIEEEKNRLITEYVDKHGRQPSNATIIKLRAQATLTTRPEKQVRSLADLTAEWRHRAGHLLGTDATSWARTVTTRYAPLLLRADDVPLDVIANLGQSVVEAVGEKRSTWRRWNLTAEAARQTMGYRFATTEDREAIVGLVVDAAEAASLRLTPPELAISPVSFRRPDGTSVFRTKHFTVFSSEVLLAAEDQLLERARTTTGPTVPLTTVEKITGRPDQEGRMLGEDQATALARIAVSGRVVDVLVGPAGAGKTAAMNALRRAWEAEHGPGSVVGLAPSAVAAQVLADDLGIGAENTAKWWQTHITTGQTFTAGKLVILDEASLAGTLSLDRIAALAADAGAKVLLVGDFAQLQSVDAGGAFSLLVHDRDDAPELVDVHRFTNSWEKTASLALRHGHTDIIDTYIDHDCITGGETEAMVDAAYTAWRTDILKGRATVLVTDSNEAVTALNTRARTDLILDGTVHGDREAELHDGSRAAIEDTVITRRNDRRLRAGRGWVRNGDRWTVADVREDGSLVIRRAGKKWGGSVVLPADYVTEHLDLGYAVTSFRAQGITTDTAHVLVDASMTRENLYVALTRGRDTNRAYVAVDRPDPRMRVRIPATTARPPHEAYCSGCCSTSAPSSPRTRRSPQNKKRGRISGSSPPSTRRSPPQPNTTAGLASSEPPVSPTMKPKRLSAPRRSGRSPPSYAEPRPTTTTSTPSFPDSCERTGSAMPTTSLPSSTTALPVPPAGPLGSGRARKAPRLIAGLIPEATGAMSPDMRQALAERRELIEARATALLDTALAEQEEWTAALGAAPKDFKIAAAWRRLALTVAAYRDRYDITGTSPLGAPAESEAQKIDDARARAALDRARSITSMQTDLSRRTVQAAARSSLSR
jgi:conjugative relaxase-like TrwC/TraI family protein